MNFRFLLTVLLFLAATFLTSAQFDMPTPSGAAGGDFVIRGKVVDAKSGEALAFATVSVNKLGLGTATNTDGQWRLQLPAKANTEVLQISYLGYTSRSIEVAAFTNDMTVSLEPKSVQMSEVVVTQKDFCKDFLKKAWDAIPSNYPTGPTLSEGFYRETQRLKDSTFLYFNEAALNVYKNTYKNTKNFGQIKVEKSRKNVFPGIDSINDVRFYGGPHFPNDLDIVFSRWDFIDPSKYSQWKIELQGSYLDKSSTIYVLTFKNKKFPNSNFQGKMYVDRDSYAFIGFDFWRPGLSALTGSQLPDREYIPGLTSIKVGYTEQNGVYQLGYINYKTNGYNTVSQKRVFKDIEYVTTSIQTENVKPIPFDKQFDYTDILSIKAQPYDSSYWKDYNILEESKIMQNQAHLSYQKEEALKQLTTVYNKELTQQDKSLLFLKRFSFDGGFAYLPFSYTNGLHQLIVDGNEIGTTMVDVGNFGLSTMDGVRFELNKKWSVFGRVSTALYGLEQFQADLGMNYRISLAPSGRWIFLDMGLAASNINTRLKLGTIPNPDPERNLNIMGKNFDSKNIVLKSGNKGWGFKPSISLAVRMGKQYEIFTEATWLRVKDLLFSKDYLQLKEKEGGIFSKTSVDLDWKKQNLILNVDGIRVQVQQFEPNPLNVRLGIRTGF